MGEDAKKEASLLFSKALERRNDLGELCLCQFDSCVFRWKLEEGKRVVIGKSKYADFREDLDGNFLMEVCGKGLLLQDLSRKLNLKIYETKLTLFKGLIIENRQEEKVEFDYIEGKWVANYNGVQSEITENFKLTDIRFYKNHNKWQASGKFFRYFHTQKSLGTSSSKLLFPFSSLHNKRELFINDQVFTLYQTTEKLINIL